MFSKFNQSWSLFQASAAVLRSDKHLIVFPIFSAIASLIITASFFIPAAMYAWSHHMFQFASHSAYTDSNIHDQTHSAMGYAFMFLFYLTQYTVVFFANTALVGAAIIRLRGGKPTIQDGFGLAMNHFRAIFGYAVLAATVGMAIRAVAERSGLLGRLGAGLFGLAWNVATYLVAPILIMENVGPIEAVKRSSALLKQTWGEQIVGNVGISYVSGLFALLITCCFVPLLIGGISMQSMPLIVGSCVLFVLALTALSLIQAALSGIYTAVVYLYASEGYTGGPFQPYMIHDAFRRS